MVLKMAHPLKDSDNGVEDIDLSTMVAPVVNGLRSMFNYHELFVLFLYYILNNVNFLRDSQSVFIPTVSEGKIKFVQHPFLIHFSHLYPHI
jgi:hypothetical protein